MSEISQRFLTVREVADVLQISTRSVQREIERQVLAAIRVGRSIRIADDELHRYLRRDGKPGTANGDAAGLVRLAEEVRQLRERVEELIAWCKLNERF